ncbi:flagellar basal body-associated FliL family protein [Photobacterium sanguinicancri]|uniref:Flagellar protein FliL n=1 Tax=Photobacterium sanguinicancri TaxID=875932 RepID=A0ABX4G041_9GAMM|nr:flagellar basal body-associated FliL family protein [Photobacterium sanguinicancri]KXI22986.1 flagellar biosynthesis protein FliL [Photobacterium sanguinicancri]OZS44531.1 flagellar biosynthesis protein FliL [Photobacterium sanguinicancri]
MTEEVKPKSKLPLIIAAGVITLALAGGGGWWYVQQQKAAAMEIAATQALPATAMVKKPVFLPLKKFVMSVKGDDRLHYLMLELSIMSYSEDQLKVLEDYMPVIRNAVITLVSGKDYESLSAQGVIPVLQSELKDYLGKVMNEMNSSNGIDRILITKMVIQ